MRLHFPTVLRRPNANFVAAAMLIGAGLGGVARADTLYIRSSTATGKPLAYNKVKVERLAKGDAGRDELYFLSESGVEGHRPLDEIVRMQLDDEPALTAAETAYANNDMKAAAEGYRQLLSARKPWVQLRARQRLAEAASKSGDFASGVAAFILASASDPAGAQKSRPSLTEAIDPQTLDAAIAQVRQAANSASEEQRQVLLPFLAELYNRKNDPASAQRVLRELNGMSNAAGGGAGRDQGTGNTAVVQQPSSAAQRAQADVAITAARDALAQRDYAQCISAITAHSSAFTEPHQQADALYLIAQAKAGSAKDAAGLKDAALAYMRVVANFKSAPDAPHVAEALLNTAAIEEKLNQPKSALSLYEQVTAEFKGTDAAKQADEAAGRLKQAGGK